MGDDRAEFDRLSAGILAGRGVVARYPGVVCVADAAGAEPVRALVALCAAVAGFEPGRPLARRLAAWLSGPDAPPSSLRFGTLADAGDRWAVFLSGAVSLHDAGTDATIPGADAAAWTDRLVTPGGPLVLLLDPLDEERPQGRATTSSPTCTTCGRARSPGAGSCWRRRARRGTPPYRRCPRLPRRPRRTRRPHRPRLRPPPQRLPCRYQAPQLRSRRQYQPPQLRSRRHPPRRYQPPQPRSRRHPPRRRQPPRHQPRRRAGTNSAEARRRCTPSPRTGGRCPTRSRSR